MTICCQRIRAMHVHGQLNTVAPGMLRAHLAEKLGAGVLAGVLVGVPYAARAPTRRSVKIPRP
jgi:hypothetical protein